VLKRFFLVFSVAVVLSWSPVLAMDGVWVITIKSVELKNTQGQWLTVIEPDKQVDLATEEPFISFFNNGRIPSGEYVNFRVSFLDKANKERSLSAIRDWDQPVVVKKGAFVSVEFEIERAQKARVSYAALTVDDTIRSYLDSELLEG
jgi:hypothetical protein